MNQIRREIATALQVELSPWRFASARGTGRRQFLRLMAAGGATAVLAAGADIRPSEGACARMLRDLEESVRIFVQGRRFRRALRLS